MEPLLMETEYEKPLVLVVDDDPTNLRILVSKLNREYRLGVAKSGTKALEYMGKQIPDLVLLDVMMPDMDGYAVCEHIKRDPRLCDIPVVFISYVDDPSQKTRGFEVGGVDYITKPFHDAEVLARVRTHIMNKQMREQLKRHNAEIGKELDEHRRQLLALLDNLPGLAYRETVIGGIPDARRAVSFVSDGVLGLTGYAPDRFMGEERLGLLDIAHEEDRETIRSAIATALKEHRRWELVYRIITAWARKNGCGSSPRARSTPRARSLPLKGRQRHYGKTKERARHPQGKRRAPRAPQGPLLQQHRRRFAAHARGV